MLLRNSRSPKPKPSPWASPAACSPRSGGTRQRSWTWRASPTTGSATSAWPMAGLPPRETGCGIEDGAASESDAEAGADFDVAVVGVIVVVVLVVVVIAEDTVEGDAGTKLVGSRQLDDVIDIGIAGRVDVVLAAGPAQTDQIGIPAIGDAHAVDHPINIVDRRADIRLIAEGAAQLEVPETDLRVGHVNLEITHACDVVLAVEAPGGRAAQVQLDAIEFVPIAGSDGKLL